MNLASSPITLGEQVRHCDVGAFSLTEAIYSPVRTLPRHAHNCATISYAVKGSCTEIVGSRSHDCQPFVPIVKPAGVFHSNRYCDSGTKSLLIEIKPSGLEMVRAFSKVLDDVKQIHDRTVMALAMRIHKEFRTMDSVSALSIEGLVLEMIGTAARHNGEPLAATSPKWLHEARTFLSEHFREPLTLFDIGAFVGINPSYLSRMFRKHYHCTVGEFVRRLRLEFAAKRIANSNDSLATIAADAGFYDQSHFSHTFKLYLGVTPAEFRAALDKK